MDQCLLFPYIRSVAAFLVLTRQEREMENIGAWLRELVSNFGSIFIITGMYVVQLPIDGVYEYLP